MSEVITLCDGCKKHKPLTPFTVWQDVKLWWVESLIRHSRLCAVCHARAVREREENPEAVPYWYWVAMRLRDYIPPPAPLELRQEDLI